LDVQKDLGTTNKYPKWAVAYKYPPEKKLTIIRDIITQTGRTGVITPVAVFDPVLLAGTSVSRATLHNQQFIDTNLGGIAIGDTVEVHKSGEIIPEILQVIKEKRPADAKLFKIETCPICGSPAMQEKDENGNVSPAHTCSNENCPAKLEKHIIYWASKNIMNIDGFGPAATQVLIQNNLLNSIPDIYRLTYSDIVGLSTQNSSVFGIAKARKLILAIEKSKSNNIDRIIAGLGIANVGRTIGAALAKKYDSIDSILEASLEDLISIDGIGNQTGKNLYEKLHSENILNTLADLKAEGLNFKSTTYNQTSEGKLTGLTFVITGTLPHMSREEAKKLIEDNGGKVTGSVSKKTSYLLAGDSAGSKLDKAKELNIKIINEDKLSEIIS
jgi:DNA ligase (NAD+)